MDAEFPGWRARVPTRRDEEIDLTRLVRITTAFEPFRKIRSEILRGERNERNERSNGIPAVENEQEDAE